MRPAHLRLVCGLAGLLGGRTAHAEGPGCTADDLKKPFQGVPSGEVERITKAVLGKIDSCKGRLTPKEEAGAIHRILLLGNGVTDANRALCRAVAERGLRLDPKEVGLGIASHISEVWGRCGGDCSKTPLVDSCKKGEADHLAELHHRMAADASLNLPVSCGIKKARQLIRTMDDAAFRVQALRYIAQYRTTCGSELSATDAATLATDEAIVRFHGDDDAGCLQALAGAADSPATAFNRALCGGPCTMEPAKCSAAADARRKAVAERPLREALRERTKAYCWDCKPGKPCEVPPLEQRPVWGQDKVAWESESTVYLSQKGKVETDSPIVWAGDLNADGIGNLLFVYHTIEPDMSSAAMNGYSLGPTDIWTVEVKVGCGSPERYARVWLDEHLLNGDDFAVESDTSERGAIKRVCVHPDATPDNKVLASPPRNCFDFSEWRKVEEANLRKPVR